MTYTLWLAPTMKDLAILVSFTSILLLMHKPLDATALI